MPTHDYAYQGEAVVGPELAPVTVWHHGGVAARPHCRRQVFKRATPTRWSKNPLLTQARTAATLTASFGYALTRSLFVHGGALYQKIHGGLTAFEIFTTRRPMNGLKRIACSRCGIGT